MHGYNMDVGNHSQDILQTIEESYTIMWPTVFYMSMILPFSIFGNIFVLAIFINNFKPSATRSFVLSVAMCSVGLASVALPLDMYSIFHRFTFRGPQICKAFMFVLAFCITALAATLLVMALHRYRKICQPLKHQMTVTMARLLRGCVCLLSFSVALPVLVLYGERTVRIPGLDITGTQCSLLNRYTDSTAITIYKFMFLTIFLGGGIIVTILYCLVARKVHLLIRCKRAPGVSYNNVMREMMVTVKRRSQSTSNERPKSTKRVSRNRSNSLSSKGSQIQPKKTTSMLAVTTLVIFVSFLPFLAMNIWNPADDIFWGPSETGKLMVYHVLLRSYYIHCAASPVVYGAFNSKFREEVRRVISFNRA